MHPINLHQTSGHAVLIIHLSSIDPTSVSSLIVPSHHAAKISFNHADSSSATLSTTVLVQPVLSQEQQRPLVVDLIQECSYSVSSENIVIRFKKASYPSEWQALQIHIKTLSSTSTNSDQSVISAAAASTTATDMEGVVEKQAGSERELSVIAKFVTGANTTSFQEAIRSQPLWEDQADSQVVGNVQAKRVPGMNAIQMTAELVAPSSSS
ncbi:hypothetical protein K457DRAFT_141244 [Linnemannia elongata AG-77]|uniref:Uncharacterized protein n=1 Tax=Linnemannia elongata AG-77 TaxID=1314771 RepID=A0A197JJE8_9FUNG|nr:hypothetical protein K457DRAFT_141244 [Linnemannia elongata AG-77]